MSAYSSAARCQQILEETAILLNVFKQTASDLTSLQRLITTHFQDDVQGKEFRSFCCYGRPGESVSLDLFNELCILPNTHWYVKLSTTGPSQTIIASLLEPNDREKYTTNFAVTAAKNIVALLNDILKTHPSASDILSHIPHQGGIPLTWSTSLLNLNAHSSSCTLPTIPILRERIGHCLNLALVKKDVQPSFKLFCKESGSFWKSIPDDSYDAPEIYLHACSEFPLYLDALLKKKGMTLDQLAGVKTVNRYPKVEAVVREGFSRSQSLPWLLTVV
jgi:hypothetical protein